MIFIQIILAHFLSSTCTVHITRYLLVSKKKSKWPPFFHGSLCKIGHFYADVRPTPKRYICLIFTLIWSKIKFITWHAKHICYKFLEQDKIYHLTCKAHLLHHFYRLWKLRNVGVGRRRFMYVQHRMLTAVTEQ